MTDESDKRAILRIQKAWTDAECAGDTESLRNFLCEDISIWPGDGDQVRGIAAAMEVLRTTDRILEISISDEEIEAGPTHAWKTARFATRIETGGEISLFRGTHLWVLRRGESGWKITGLSWNIDN